MCIRDRFTTEKGRILDLADVLHLEDKTLLFCSAAHYNKLLIWLNRYIIMEEIKVEGAAEKYLTLDFIGSQSVSFLSLISGLRAEEIDSALTHKTFIEGTEVLIARLTELNGVKKYRLIAKAEESENIIGHILAGKSAFDVRFVGSDAYETFRVENRIPKAPEELNDSYNPHEARLLDYVSFTKGCYIGQEVIARLDTYNKVQKQLVKLELSGADDPKAQDVILDESGAEAGVITSVAPQGVIEKRIALAYVKIGLLESGEELTVKGSGQTYTAKNLNTPEDK
jgi:folate-binding protein YgfZ